MVFARAMVPLDVMVPPDSPVPAVMLVTVPGLPPGITAHVPSPRKKLMLDGVPVIGLLAGLVTLDSTVPPFASKVPVKLPVPFTVNL